MTARVKRPLSAPEADAVSIDAEEVGGSAGHQLGQLIGDWWERYIALPVLQAIASELDLFLDNRFVERAGRATGDRIVWPDDDGNVVDYDFVMELGGTTTAQGVPVAFVEVFWRRGARHSKDKSRDDSGKLMPMRDTYPTARFLGIAACGEFTKPARTLVISRDIDLFFVPKTNIVDAFAKNGMTIDYPDKLSESSKRDLVRAFAQAFTEDAKRLVAETLFADLGEATVDAYSSRVRSALAATPVEIRFIESRYSTTAAFDTVTAASRFLDDPKFEYAEDLTSYTYEITYSDGYEFSRNVHTVDHLRDLHNQLVHLHEHMEDLARKKRLTRGD